MDKMNKEINVILTSPPYNTSRTDGYSMSKDKYNSRYVDFLDNKTDQEYIQWTVDLFNKYESVLKENGVILYNLSYSSENTYLMWMVLAEIIKNTQFTVADCIVWKKKSAIPNNRSSNKLTRIVEYIFVFCRKTELKTFKSNKKVVSIIEKTGQKNYENIMNFIEAKNNDGSCELNKATYSTELCEKLLGIYANDNCVVYDSFIGTGTTAMACNKLNLKYIGSEISQAQCQYALQRINNLN
jgi:site-specific DNA-methyltransferase (adenine-specific)